MKTKLLLLCALLPIATRASTYVGNHNLVAPFTTQSTVVFVGNLTLGSTGLYEAPDWFVVGNVYLPAAGECVLSARTGRIRITGNLYGPHQGSATLRVSHRTGFSVVGQIDRSVEIVDGSTPAEPATPPVPVNSAPLVNLSTRTAIGPGGTATAGFVVGGKVARRVLVRAIGPGLRRLGITAALHDPHLEVHAGTEKVAANDNWNSDLIPTFSSVGAFALPPDSNDAAIVLTLSPGPYTALARSQSTLDSGEILLEIYLVE